MKNAETLTVDGFAKRSDRTVTKITIVFALGGALADIASHVLAAIFNAPVGMLWGLWIPLCFLLIPTVHYLSRQVVTLRERLDALEKRVGSGELDA
jgi:hypothetical protein